MDHQPGRRWRAALAPAAIVVTDRITKALAHRPRHNDGFAFQVVRGERITLVVAATASLALFALGAVRYGRLLGLPRWAVGFVLAGATSNPADRIVYGSVIDFIRLPWWTVNVADVAVAVGIVAMLLTLVARVVAVPVAALRR